METPWVDARGNDRPRAPPWVSDEVSKLISVLKRQWLLYGLSEDLPPTCWPFIIPKTSEKVSLILSGVKQNGLDGCTSPRFLLRSWEQLSNLLVRFYPGVPLYGTHIDLKNAFWSFVLPESAHTVFRLRSGPSGRVVGQLGLRHGITGGGGGGRTSPPDVAASLARSAKLGADELAACATFGPNLLRFAGGPIAAPARATPMPPATPTPMASVPLPSAEAPTASVVRAVRACRRTVPPTTLADPSLA